MQLAAAARARKADWSPFVVAQWPGELVVLTGSCCFARWAVFPWDS